MFVYFIYQPTIFSITLPFALLSYGTAHTIWLLLTAATFILASFLMWDIGSRYGPVASGGLVLLILANSELLLITGNAAGLAIGLCIISAWGFYTQRFAFAAAICLAISLIIKPHDSGLVWLYFLLAGGVHRKRAMQTLVVALVLAVPAVLWISHIAPHWMQELSSNLSTLAAKGGLNDPRPATTGGRGIAMLISLQSIFSAFSDNPRIYNTLTLLTCAPILLIWAANTLRHRVTAERTWLGLAAIAPLTMLPVYHREPDAKLLLLSIPACAMLWATGRPIGRVAVILTSAAILLTGDIPWAVFFSILNKVHLTVSSLSMLNAVEAFPQPLILLTICIFYLWLYVRYDPNQAESNTEHSSTAPIEL